MIRPGVDPVSLKGGHTPFEACHFTDSPRFAAANRDPVTLLCDFRVRHVQGRHEGYFVE
jgi:hypothetical protein